MPIAKPGSSDQYNLFDSIVPSLCFTNAEWLTMPIVTLANVLLIERDTGKMKISDGTHYYLDLEYYINRTLTDTELDLIQGINKPNGLAGLTDAGLLPDSIIPDKFKRTMLIIGTYLELIIAGDDPITGADFRLHSVLVIDATGDPSGRVKKGGAQYAWYDPDGPGDRPSGWQITSVIEEPMMSLANYFKLIGDNANTIGDIADDVDVSKKDPAKFKKFSFADADHLGTIERGSDVTDSDNVEAAGAVMYTHVVIGKQVNAARLEAIFGSES